MTGQVVVTSVGGCGGGKGRRGGEEDQNPASPVALLLAALRKSMVACSVDSPDDVISAVHHPMEIGWPTNVKHVSHVTFDRFNGFLGLPLELEVHVPAPVPSARYSFLRLFKMGFAKNAPRLFLLFHFWCSEILLLVGLFLCEQVVFLFQKLRFFPWK